MIRSLLPTLLLLAAAASAEKMTAPQLIEMAKKNSAGLKEALVESMGEANLKNGTAVLGRGENFIFAVEAATRPTLQLDDSAGPAMTKVKGSDLWFATGRLKTGTAHAFLYTIDSKPF